MPHFGRKLLVIYFIIFFAFNLSCSNKNKNNNRENKADSDKFVSVSDLNKVPVIGVLGIPLGEPAKILAIIIDGDSLIDKVHSSSYLLKVIEVNGKKLSSQPILEFSLDHADNVNIALDNYGLYYLIHGVKVESLTASQISNLKIGYVGKSVRLVVYETGQFSGMPTELPDSAYLWQDHGFRFESILEILLMET